MGMHLWSINLKILCKLGMNLGGIPAPFHAFHASRGLGESPRSQKKVQASLGQNVSYISLSMWPTPDESLIKAYLTQAQYTLKLTLPPTFRERLLSSEIFTVNTASALFSPVLPEAWSCMHFLMCARNCASQLWVPFLGERGSTVDILIFELLRAPPIWESPFPISCNSGRTVNQETDSHPRYWPYDQGRPVAIPFKGISVDSRRRNSVSFSEIANLDLLGPSFSPTVKPWHNAGQSRVLKWRGRNRLLMTGVELLEPA